jgi:hypothetical protein
MKLRRGKKVRKVEGKNKRKAPTDKGKKNKVGTNARKINEEYERTGWREVSTAIGILFVSRWRSRSKDKEDIIMGNISDRKEFRNSFQISEYVGE